MTAELLLGFLSAICALAIICVLFANDDKGE